MPLPRRSNCLRRVKQRDNLQSYEFPDASGAIAEALLANTRLFQQRQMNVRQSYRLGVFDVPSAFVPTNHDAREIRMVMDIRVAETTANQVRGMIEQCTVTVRRGFQLVHEVGEEGNVIGIDLRQLCQLLGIVRVM